METPTCTEKALLLIGHPRIRKRTLYYLRKRLPPENVYCISTYNPTRLIVDLACREILSHFPDTTHVICFYESDFMEFKFNTTITSSEFVTCIKEKFAHSQIYTFEMETIHAELLPESDACHKM